MMTEMIELAGQIGMAGESTLTVARRRQAIEQYLLHICINRDDANGSASLASHQVPTRIMWSYSSPANEKICKLPLSSCLLQQLIITYISIMESMTTFYQKSDSSASSRATPFVSKRLWFKFCSMTSILPFTINS